MTTTKTPILPFPLSWPTSWPRTATADRKRSQFGTDHAGTVSLTSARAFVLDELARLGAANVLITSDLPVSRDDLQAATGRGTDPGIAAWFMLNGAQRVLACDKWTSHAENLHAIGLTVQAMRGLERWGAGDVVERAMAGFAALPAGSGETATEIAQRKPVQPSGPRAAATILTDWRAILRTQPGDDLAAVKKRYRLLMSAAHPDQGGRNAIALRLNEAMAEAEIELGRAQRRIG